MLLNSRIAVWIGIYSYSIYLIHRVIIVALVDNNPVLGEQPVVLSALAFILSFAFAALVDRYVDSHFRQQRAAFHRTPTVEPAPVKRAAA
ncbi:hypothetical protein LHFGNBLO_001664 [Mesorhizobium sp. AR10]|uniref:hypothetical protein n=1 Tax=Mesorhizobium sp. AR10 TaxID=2865839 RepID=UPI00215ED435|nr:hypothetical protein [Mesorhizobium sp. AR10]UVK40224.1 hypothetical protein LHFGNBLO_001664 [Mesorhizobium sp. AR10]